jgi:pimeloyl-ACP methyl ester carboxylesterase
MVEELRALLAVAGVAPPYVLVGHSFGGMNVRLFATRYPAEVAGLVLVDPSHEDGRTRILALLPSDEQEMHLRGNPEGVDWEASVAELGAAGPLPPMPVVVLFRGQPALAPPDRSADRVERWEVIWRGMQEDLVRRIPGSRHIIAERSRHYIQRFQPDLVTAVIRDLVEAARYGSSRVRPGSRS